MISTVAPPIPFHVPNELDLDEFVEDARAILASGRLSLGPYVERVEAALAPWVGPGTVVAVSNGSDGLIAALWAIREAGAEVIVPGFTYLATWQAVVWAGMTPVVADVDDRGLLDPVATEAAIGPRTRAILGVHMAGRPADLAGLRAIADRHGLALLFDSAHALGARWVDRPVGAGGDLEVFSIGPTKQLGVSEGGFVVVNDPAVESAVRRFATQGHRPGELDALVMGMNLRMPELTAAMALRALPELDARLARREAIHAWYRDAWCDLPLRIQDAAPGERSAHKDELVFVDDPATRAPLRDHLAAAGVATRQYYDPAIPDLTAFSGLVASADRSRDLARRSFAVPIHGRLSDTDVDRVIAAMLSFPGLDVTERAALILVGAAAFAEEITDLCLLAGVPVAGWIEGLDRSRGDATAVPPIVWVDDEAGFEPALRILPAIGSVARRGIVERLVGEGRSLATFVHPSAVIAPSAVVEPGCVVFPNVVVGARSRIGRGTIVNRGALVGHHTSIGAFSFVGPGANVAGKVTIGEGVHIGIGAIVRDGLTVGDGATIGAGAVAVGPVAAGTTVVGIPARPIDRR